MEELLNLRYPYISIFLHLIKMILLFDFYVTFILTFNFCNYSFGELEISAIEFSIVF